MAGITRHESEQRQALVVEKVAEGIPIQQALVEVGYSESYARTDSRKILERSLKKSPMIDALDEVGVTTKYLARKIKHGTMAKKTQRLVVDHAVEEYTDIDHGTRHRYIETALRLRGEDPGKTTESASETFEERVRRLRGIGVQKPQGQIEG